MKFKSISIFLLIYFGIRIFTYFFGPITPLQTASDLNGLVAEVMLISTIYLLVKNNTWGWIIIALEIILGGAGGFLSVGPIALRTLLLVSSLTIFFGRKIWKKELLSTLKENLVLTKIITALFAVVAFSAIRGLALGHPASAVFADSIPYLFFLYYYPLREMWKEEKFRETCYSAFLAAIIGNAVFVLFTLIGFSADWFAMQGSYYHWFRDVALGKITDLNNGFYRIVLNEHLLLVPIILYFLHGLMHEIQNRKKLFFSAILGTLLLMTLSINLTRIYLVALAVGTLILLSRKLWKRWLFYSAWAGVMFILLFSTLYFASTRGQSYGLEFFGIRLQSVVQPSIEDSSLSRMMLLPKIWGEIKTHPIIGNGLGDSVTVYSPVFRKEISTPQFDWGYLELWAELGIIGLGIWLILLGFCINKFVRDGDDERRFLLASIVCLVVINITSPALFHVMCAIILITILNNLTVKKYGRSI